MGGKELNETTKRVFEFIKENPGLNFNEISRRLGLAKGDLQYHLYKLEKMGMVKSKRSGLKRHYFPAGIFSEKEEDVLSLISSENMREIIMYLITNPGITQKELCEKIGLSPPTINYYMSKLEKLGLVEGNRAGKFVRYYFVEDRELFIKMIRNYHPSLLERWADRIVDIFLDFGGD
ncbi:winged helix-turn-helix transcriptional regulator [Thermococcus sp. M39]|uniref:winged helix-turn-helix transcriptional regulator n=1 Tax=unclassified Thermococcus TaxID=2627626 RepID=UPI00143A7043|nr:MULTISPECIES: winged helix-turn-helix transcriptional regulator [unclassified Thermococcus]NJE07670.1 winged helix-turn-helix transcriptional regulator [Thermococcus sp. M39]NJE12226.1 winged helix-turn-helix transcriptional regulator [Thermococcus sp. LS2]